MIPDKVINKADYQSYYRRLKEYSKRPEAKISGLISLTIFTVAFFGVFAIMPTMKTIAKLNKDIKDAETVNNQLAKKVFSLEKAQDLYVQQVETMPLVNKVLPDQVDFERLAWQLNWLVKEKNLTLVTSNFEEFLVVGTQQTKDKLPQPFQLDITVRGDYSQIKDFAGALLTFDRLLTVKQATITSKKSKNTDNKILANFKLTAYWQPAQL